MWMTCGSLCFPWPSGTTRHNIDSICKMGRRLGCVLLPFSEAGARSIKLRHFSPWKEKDYFRRWKLAGVSLPPLSAWGSCPHSQSLQDLTLGTDIPLCPHPAQTHCAQGLQPLDQECGLQGVKGNPSLLPEALLGLWCSFPRAEAVLVSVQGDTNTSAASFTHTFVLLFTRQCLCPHPVWPNLPVLGSLPAAHALHR